MLCPPQNNVQALMSDGFNYLIMEKQNKWLNVLLMTPGMKYQCTYVTQDVQSIGRIQQIPTSRL